MLLASATVWLLWPEQGGNFFAEMLGITLTVLMIERLLDWDREARRRPARLAAFAEALRLGHRVNLLLFSVAESTVPASEVEKLKGSAGAPTEWLASYFEKLRPEQPAPFHISSRPGPPTWAEMLPANVAHQQAAIAQYLARHTTHGHPGLTKALGELELNSINEILGYGHSVFWQSGSHEAIWLDFIRRAENLFRVIKDLAPEFPEETEVLAKVDFDWSGLARLIAEHPIADPRAPFRPM